MRMKCPHCQSKGTITHTVTEVIGQLTILYLECGNPSCRARTVHQLSYSHDAVPPSTDLLQVALEIMEKLPPEKRRKLLNLYRPAGAPLSVEAFEINGD